MARSEWEWPEHVGVVYAAGFKAGLLAGLHFALDTWWMKAPDRKAEIERAIAHVHEHDELPEEAGDA